MERQLNSKKDYQVGIACAILCAVVWGILPVYWKSLQSIDSFVIMFYRLILAFVFVLVICLIAYKPKGIIEPLKKKKAVLVFFFAGLTIATNWSIYIWSVNAGYIIQTSIGYYIEPLFVCLFGVVFFKEKLDIYKGGAIVLAFVGVAVMIISYGQLPVIALSLAVTFAVYAAIKKMLHAPALLALLYETGLMLPIAIPAIIYLEASGRGVLAAAEPHQLALLSLAGVFTATPLVLFAMAANRISMIALGVTEYISPSMGLLLGIFVYREPFDLYQFIGFCIIWVGLVIFTLGSIKESKTMGTGSDRETVKAAEVTEAAAESGTAFREQEL